MAPDPANARIPLVTWMIPVLNGMPYLPLTLASIEAQTFKDFQVVVWDNGSTDSSVEEASRLIPSRIPGNVMVNRPMSLGDARAAMVAECTSEFGALIDADDLNSPDRLARQVEFMQANPDIAVLGTQLRKIDSAGHESGQLVDYPLSHENIVQEMLRSNPIGQPGVLFRCSAIVSAGNYRDVKVEDYDLWLRVAAKKFRLANLPQALVDYRIHQKSTTQQQLVANSLQGYMNAHLMKVARQLFGCSGETLERLKLRNHPLALIPLIKIARHLRIEQSPWRSATFIRAARQMVARRDLLSRLVLAILERSIR